jgi:drug/metabolite transporter (DMT)-like permease
MMRRQGALSRGSAQPAALLVAAQLALPAVSRPLVWTLYGSLVLIWSSTWVAIKIGLEDVPPLLSAGVRFAIAGAGLLALARALDRPLRTDATLATLLGLLPFAAAYGLIYWGEQYVPSGLAAVLFGVMPLYSAAIAAVALADEPLQARLVAGIGVAIGGLALAFGESLALGDARWALLAASACALAPLASAIGNVAIKRRAQRLDPIALNGWAMLGGGALLLITSALAEDWGAAAWSGQAVGSIAYLAAIGSAVPFVTLTVLLRELRAVTVSYITLLLPFGALAFGAALYDEQITLAALGGALLVASGLAVAAR